MEVADANFKHRRLKIIDFDFQITLLSLILCVLQTKGISNDVVVTYDHLYTSGLNAYSEGKWFQCAAFLEKAIEERNFCKTSLNECRLFCRKTNNSTVFPSAIPPELNSSVDIFRLDFFGDIVKESHCMKKCKLEKLGAQRADNRVLPEVQEDFENFVPYSFLQFCYFKLERYEDAASAAYTFFLRNPEDEDTIRNIQLYRQQYKVQDQDFRDLEKKKYQIFRIKAETAYDKDDLPTVIKYIELALVEFYKEEERCRVDCEGAFDHQSYPDFIHAIADHYISVLNCQIRCEKKLSVLHKDYLPDYVGQHYNYLQYAYHKLGDNDKAVEAAATYLLFHPSDVEMLRNRAFYMQKLGYHKAHFVPRKEAVEYESRRNKMFKLLYFIRDEYDVYSDEDVDESKKKDKVVEEELDKMKLNLEDIEANKTSQTLDKEHYMNMYKKLGINITTDKDHRFVADDFFRPDQCRQLVDFANTRPADANGVRTMTVSDGLQHIKENPDSEISLRLFLRASELSRHFSAHFNNKTNFFIKKASIVCVDPGPKLQEPENCIPQEDGGCISEDEIDSRNTLKDEHLMISFLTYEDKPGHFNFLDRRLRNELPIASKCGRVVGFKASDGHRSERSESQRCSMILTLTSDRKEDSPKHREASSYLLDQEKDRMESKTYNDTQAMQKFFDKGVSIAKGKEDFGGRERFAADGLLTEEQCQILIDMVEEGGISGDGYNNRKSPHSNRELFNGLTLSRAVELAHVGVISKKSAQFYLDASEYGRSLVEKYFNLTQPLYFDYTHLVCRTALEGEQDNRTDLSHPVHGDNCELMPDGTCVREFPSYVQRDYSSIVYLNGDFEGGEFFFAHGNKTPEVLLKPRCGRLVGFNAAEIHGVKAVTKGKRCALAMWYTMDLNHKELARIQAQKLLNLMPDAEAEEDEGFEASSDFLDKEFGVPDKETNDGVQPDGHGEPKLTEKPNNVEKSDTVKHQEETPTEVVVESVDTNVLEGVKSGSDTVEKDGMKLREEL